MTEGLTALGMIDGAWSGWYGLFSCGRYEERKAAKVFVSETLEHTRVEEPCVTGVDGVQIPRSSLKMAGTSWLNSAAHACVQSRDSSCAAFFTWFVVDADVSRVLTSIRLRFLPAFPSKAKPASVPPQREWEAGLSFRHWVRQELNEAGREQQLLLNLADGSFDVLDFWRGLPEHTVLAVRTARNRRLYYLPERHTGPGRPASYGALAPHPCDWLHKGI